MANARRSRFIPLQVRLTRTDKLKLKTNAEAPGVSMSEYMRRAIREETMRKEMEALLTQLRNNIAELAKRA